MRDNEIKNLITDLGSSVKINARLISAETGKLFSVASTQIIKDDTIRKLLEEKADLPDDSNIRNQENFIVVKDDFRFELIEARLSNRTAVVQIKLTNMSKDDKDLEVTYGWQYQTKIFDDMGNESVISSVKFANQLQKIVGLSQYSAAKKKIVAGNSINMELNFEKVSAKATRISLLQILYGYRGFNVEFRDIPLKQI